MNAPSVAAPQGDRPWLLLIHQLPPKPDYLRVKVRRRLHKLGAVPLKSSVYVLPSSDGTVEDFQWLANEIVADGGDATICVATLLSGVSDDDLIRLFRSQRAAEYEEVRAAATALDVRGGVEELTRLRQRLTALAVVDFFEAPERGSAESAIADAERRLRPGVANAERPATGGAPRNAVWVTRKGVFIDRIASAWLIRRFIDPDARFRFVAPSRYRHTEGEIRFDMYRGEFTHVGELCTFEVLAGHFCPGDAALHAIAEIVHDIDCKDEKFGRHETAGIAAVIQGIAYGTDDDEERLRQGAAVFEGLYMRVKRQK